jgi:hypothetical protein
MQRHIHLKIDSILQMISLRKLQLHLGIMESILQIQMYLMAIYILEHVSITNGNITLLII